MKLIPFDLDAALSGAEVRTRDGRKVDLFERRKGRDHLNPRRDVYPYKAKIGSSSGSYMADGKYSMLGLYPKDDLFLVEPERETIWTCGTRWPENKFARKEGV